MGIHRPKGSASQWQTLDGSPLVYQDWNATREAADGSEDRLVGVLPWGEGGQWLAVRERGNRSAVCEAEESALAARLAGRGLRSSYLLVPGMKGYFAAVQACSDKGSYHLASVQSWEEAEFILGKKHTLIIRHRMPQSVIIMCASFS